MAISDSTLRSNVFSELRSALISASLTASDLDSSSISPSILAAYNDKDKYLPQVVIGHARPVSTGRIAFNDGFDAERLIEVNLDLYTRRIPHLDQLADQIQNYFSTNTVSGLPLVSWEEDDELTEPNDNKVHHKTIFLGFRRW